MNKDTESIKEMLEQIASKIPSIPVFERKRSLALMNIYSKLLNIDKNVKAAYNEYLDDYDYRNIETSKLNHDIISGNKIVYQAEVKHANLFVDVENSEATLHDEENKPIEKYYAECLINSKCRYNELVDELPLKSLTNITIERKDKENNSKNYTLEIKFYFKENTFFKNEELIINAYYENSEIVKSEGTNIEWLVSDITVKKVEKKQKNKKTGQKRVIIKEKRVNSFFNLFDNFSKDDSVIDEENDDEEDVMNIYKIEENIEEFKDILGFSLEYYLGLVNDLEDNVYDDNNEEKAPELVGYDKPKRKESGKSNKSKGKKEEDKPECKNQ